MYLAILIYVCLNIIHHVNVFWYHMLILINKVLVIIIILKQACNSADYTQKVWFTVKNSIYLNNLFKQESCKTAVNFFKVKELWKVFGMYTVWIDINNLSVVSTVMGVLITELLIRNGLALNLRKMHQISELLFCFSKS